MRTLFASIVAAAWPRRTTTTGSRETENVARPAIVWLASKTF